MASERPADGKTRIGTARAWRASALAAAMSWATTTAAAPPSVLAPTTTDARAVAKAAVDRPTGDHMTATISMTVHDSLGRERSRRMSQRSLDFDGGTKTLVVFEEPNDVKDTGLLSIDYTAGAREDDQWLYLPSLRKATRVSSANASESFLGTDLTFADITKVDTSDYDYAMLNPSITVDGDECWLIEARARSERERKRTGYLKSDVWIAKATLLPIQSKTWVIDGQKLKYMRMSNIQRISGIWTAKRLTVKVVRNGAVESWTTMDTLDVKYDESTVNDSLFTVRHLEGDH